MGKASNIDFLAEACNNGDLEACETLRRKRMAAYGMKDGGLLADASRTWRMEAEYPEFEKGVADRLSKERIPEAEIEEQFNYSPLQRGYAEGGEVDNFMDETGSMLAPEAPLNFEDDMLCMNQLLNREIKIKFIGYQCLSCNSDIEIYRQGFCKNCFFDVPQAADWIIKPE